MKSIDVNTGWGFWPLQKFAYQKIEEMAGALSAVGVEESWVSAIESIAYPETECFDRKLAEAIRGHSLFRFVKTVNPLFPNWKGEVALMTEAFGSPIALKVYPNYHDYNIGDLGVVAEFALENNLPLLIQVRVNDERNQPTFMQVKATPSAEIAALSRAFPELRIIALCAYTNELSTLASGSDNLFVEPSFFDSYDPLMFAAEKIEPSRLVFGSHAPFLYPMASALKLRMTELKSAAAIGARASLF